MTWKLGETKIWSMRLSVFLSGLKPLKVPFSATGGEDAVNRVLLVHVKVAREDDGLAFCYFPDTPDYQPGTLPAGNNAHMIQVQIEEIECLACFPATELAPGTDARTGGIPSQAWLVGCFGKPEVPLLQQPDGFPVVKDDGVFSLSLAVVTSYAYVVIVRKQGFHIVQLFGQNFLGT